MYIKILSAFVIITVILIIYYINKSVNKTTENSPVVSPPLLNIQNKLVPVNTLQLNKTISCYENCDYNGAKYEYNIGDYPFIGQEANDKISSIQVPLGLEVELYEHGNFGGRSIILRENERCLVDKNFNDLTSSLKVRML